MQSLGDLGPVRRRDGFFSSPPDHHMTEAIINQHRIVIGRVVGLSQPELLGPGRASRQVAGRRQLAAYLMVTELGYGVGTVGRLLKRDRTTVSYSCHRVEDKRDEGCFDREVDLKGELLKQMLEI